MSDQINKIISVVNEAGGVCLPNNSIELVVFTAKPVKITSRLFVYIADRFDKKWFAKVSLDDDQGLRRENMALDYLVKNFKGSTLEDTVSVRHAYCDSILVQEFLDGFPFSNLLNHYLSWPHKKALLKKHCLGIVEWLVNFHTFHSVARRPWEIKNQTPQGIVHGDFKPSNVLISNGKIYQVIDWEHFNFQGIQIYDLFHFLTYLALTCMSGRRLDRFKYSFVQNNWMSKLLNESCQVYCKAIGIPMEILKKTYTEYLGFILERRVKLGFSNRGYFMKDIHDFCQTCTVPWRVFS